MKLIINIDENVYTRLFDNGRPMDIADGIVMERAIRNGTPIPDNATNLEVMRIIFPKIGLYYEWYNEPYQKGDKE